MFKHSEKLNPCKCESKRTPDLDSDDMIPCWAVRCFDCGQFQNDSNWTMSGAVEKWNRENPIKESNDHLSKLGTTNGLNNQMENEQERKRCKNKNG